MQRMLGRMTSRAWRWLDLWRCRPRSMFSQTLGGPSGAEDIFVLRLSRVLRTPVQVAYCNSLLLKPINGVWSSDIEAITPPSVSETTSQAIPDIERTRVCEGATGLRYVVLWCFRRPCASSSTPSFCRDVTQCCKPICKPNLSTKTAWLEASCPGSPNR